MSKRLAQVPIIYNVIVSVKLELVIPAFQGDRSNRTHIYATVATLYLTVVALSWAYLDKNFVAALM